MPRKSRHFSDKATRLFVKGTGHRSPHAAIASGARTEEEWAALLDGLRTRFYKANGLKARRNVKKRHPMTEVQVAPN